ncbi:Phytochrome C [Zea mays]|uniref:Phytochrome C n=1 Tax=Zea mays TaxID=4577 RepID=A0A1D6G6Q3_MAIZE|nr:Phytochrome C [Zea mays]
MKKIQGLLELRTVTNEMVRLIETATARVLAVDIAGNINGWNKKAAELTGLPVMEAIGRPLIDLVVADSVEVVKQILDSALQGIEEQNLEIKLKTFHEQECCGPVILMINSNVLSFNRTNGLAISHLLVLWYIMARICRLTFSKSTL